MRLEAGFAHDARGQAVVGLHHEFEMRCSAASGAGGRRARSAEAGSGRWRSLRNLHDRQTVGAGLHRRRASTSPWEIDFDPRRAGHVGRCRTAWLGRVSSSRSRTASSCGRLARPAVDVARDDLGQPARRVFVETEEAHRFADGVVLKIGGTSCLRSSTGTPLSQAQLDGLVAGLEVAVDQQAVDGLARDQRVENALVVEHVGVHQQDVAATREGASATVCTVSTLPRSKRGFSTISTGGCWPGARCWPVPPAPGSARSPSASTTSVDASRVRACAGGVRAG